MNASTATAANQQLAQAGDAGDQPRTVLRPAVDIFENDHAITLCANLPGVPEKGLVLEVEGDTLSIRGDIQIDVPQGTESLHADVRSTSYQRAFTLSKELDTEQVAASLSDGVLTVTIPKREEVRPRKIEVALG